MAERPVLVTRPASQAGPLRDALAAHGFTPVPFPLLDIQPRQTLSAAERDCLARLDEFHALVFISANAVEQGMNWMQTLWPQPPLHPHWLCVGPASAAALATRGVDATCPRDRMDSEGLLAMPELEQVNNRQVAIFKGEGGRGYLREQLESRGAIVHELALYTRVAPTVAPHALYETVVGRGCVALLISSGEGLDNMVSLLDEREFATLSNYRLVVPGDRVAARAKEHGFKCVVRAANAADAAMVAALEASLASEEKA